MSSMPTAVSAAVTRTVRPSTLHLLRVRKQINILNLNLFEFIFLFVGDCLPRRAGAPLGEAADEEEHEEEDADDADHLMILNRRNPN